MFGVGEWLSDTLWNSPQNMDNPDMVRDVIYGSELMIIPIAV